MDLNDCRERIDKIDDELLSLFLERMDVCRQVGIYKKEHGLPVPNAEREKEVLSGVTSKAGEELRPFALRLYETLLEISREYQEGIIQE